MSEPRLPVGERGPLHLRLLVGRKVERIIAIDPTRPGGISEWEAERKAAPGFGASEMYATLEMDGRWQDETRIRGRLRHRDWSAFWLSAEGVWTGGGKDHIEVRRVVIHHDTTAAVLVLTVRDGDVTYELNGDEADASARVLLAGLPLLSGVTPKGRPPGPDLRDRVRFIREANKNINWLREKTIPVSRKALAEMSWKQNYGWFRQRLKDYQLPWPPPESGWPEK